MKTFEEQMMQEVKLEKPAGKPRKPLTPEQKQALLQKIFMYAKKRGK